MITKAIIFVAGVTVGAVLTVGYLLLDYWRATRKARR